MATTEDSTNTTTEVIRPLHQAYDAFSTHLVEKLFSVNSLVAGADSIIVSGTKWEESEELADVRNLLAMLNKNIDEIISSIDGTGRIYTLKQ